MGDEDLVSVVIPARDEEAFIEGCLESVLAQEGVALEVLVVDGASRDRTAAIVDDYARRDPRVSLLHNPAGIVPSSLNIALAAARGRWLVRVDAHATVPPGYVRRVVDHLSTGQWGGVGGRKDGRGITPAGRAVAAAMASRFGVGDSTYHHGTEVQTTDHVPFGAYPTALARELGGWDEGLRVNQDYEFDYRLRLSGRELLFDPSLVIDWYCRQSLSDLWRQYLRYGRGKARMIARNPRSVRLRHLAAPALVGSWALAAALFVVGRRRWALVLSTPYPIALAFASAATARRLADRRDRRYVPGAFLAMHAGWGLGWWRGMAESVAGERRRGGPTGT